MKEFKNAGLVLDALMKSHRIGQVALALDTGLTTKTINMICKGNAGHITADVAAKLEHYFPLRSAEYWLEMDMKNKLHKAREKLQKKVNEDKQKADKFLKEIDSDEKT